MCGDGEINGQEACDGDDLGGKKCSDFANQGFGGGTLACLPNCTFDTAECCKIAGQGCLLGVECCSGSCLLTCQ